MADSGRLNSSGDVGAAGNYAVPNAGTSGLYGRPTRLLSNNPMYADPDPTSENGYVDSPVAAWAPGLRVSPEGVPDATRLQQIPLHDYRPDQGPPDAFWLNPQTGPGYEEQRRHNSQEFVDADGWTMQRGVGAPGKRAAPDPRRTPPEEPRLTNQMSPSRYTFTRPFDQHAARHLDGSHFSMADHRRNYPVMGMAPVGYKRNTYRADPTPWDVDIVDVPQNAVDAYQGAGGYISSDVPWNTSRSMRLG